MDGSRLPILDASFDSVFTYKHVTATYLLFEVSSFLFINENQVEIVAHREFLVDVFHGWCQLIAAEEQSNGN